MNTMLPASSYQLPEKAIAKTMSRRVRLKAGSSQLTAGFTLVEMIVSVGLFAIVMLVCVGALLALVGANRKVQSLQSVMNNLNVTLDGMVRAIRMGSTFHCGPVNIAGISDLSPLTAADCSNTDPSDAPNHYTFAFQPLGNDAGDKPVVYNFNPTTKQLERSVNGGALESVTSSEVTIDSFQFYVVGSTRGCSVTPCDLVQPKVMAVIKGTAPVANSKARTTFHIQVTAVQRILDL